MMFSSITLLCAGCLLAVVNAGKLVYYSNQSPPKPLQDTAPTANYWPNYDVLPIEEYDVGPYPSAWYPLPWQPVPLAPLEVAPLPTQTNSVVAVESRQIESTTTPAAQHDPDEAATVPEGRHLHHKHKKHHKHHKHQTASVTYIEPEEFHNANVGQLRMTILQIEHKLQELKLQLFGSRTLAFEDDDRDEEEVNNSNLQIGEDVKRLEENKQSIDDQTEVTTLTSILEEDHDLGKILLDDNTPAAELEVEHREMDAGPFDKGRSLTENVQMWFEGLDLGKIAALPLQESEERKHDEDEVDVLDAIDVRGAVLNK
ncbi:uncharacterized protein LOC121595537 [Anopheles merus]|uniref:uncharacterized protein LOC121595537 n=1 Tax=Anopheles merus TaxID=30066 RepID=UPI001BE4A370|nr:uncharacterized protein LOC121595537 [Anopheles merus]